MFVIVSEIRVCARVCVCVGGRTTEIVERKRTRRVILFCKKRVGKPFIKCLFEGGKLAWQTQARKC